MWPLGECSEIYNSVEICVKLNAELAFSLTFTHLPEIEVPNLQLISLFLSLQGVGGGGNLVLYSNGTAVNYTDLEGVFR